MMLIAAGLILAGGEDRLVRAAVHALVDVDSEQLAQSPWSSASSGMVPYSSCTDSPAHRARLAVLVESGARRSRNCCWHGAQPSWATAYSQTNSVWSTSCSADAVRMRGGENRVPLGIGSWVAVPGIH